MAEVYVTGANGQLGSCLKKLAPDFNYIDREDLDLSNTEAICDFFTDLNKKKKIDLIIHAAAYTQVDKAESEKEIAFRVNAEASAELAKYCEEFVYISTDYVYKSGSDKELTEDAPLSPENVYGESKLKGEQLSQRNNSKTWIFRTSWLYSEYGHNFVKSMLRLAKEKKQLRIVNDQIGCPTYAMDLADAILKIVRGKVPYGVYNFCNSEKTSWYGFAKQIFLSSDIEIEVLPIPTSDFPTPAKRPLFSAMSTGKIAAIIGQPRNWKLALEDCLGRLS